MSDRIRIGGACGFWGEAGHATAQLLAHPDIDVLIYDYLAEITLSIMARARQKDPAAGYARDFVTEVMAKNAAQIAEQGVKILSNAGGMNPDACAEALREVLRTQGLELSVAVVTGDDLLGRVETFADVKEMESGAAFPDAARVASINAYMGAFPIAAALSAGADIVITGRCADSALALAAGIHRFGWGPDDLDLLAAGSLAGHLIECGPQSTGGNFTDWEMAGDIAQIGYPVAELQRDGTIEITKPAGTSGLVTPASVTEQLLYEIGDPSAYLLPDVICDFRKVSATAVAQNLVRVTGARGRAPTGRLKVSATYADGFRAGIQFQFNGRDARRKAEAYVRAGLDRAQARIGAPFAETCIELFGGRPDPSKDEQILVKVAVRHADPRAVGVFLKEQIGLALATPPGLHFFTGAGRPKPSPVVRLFSCLIAADEVQVEISRDGTPVPYEAPVCKAAAAAASAIADPEEPRPGGDLIETRLETLAFARSGDKGDAANIGVIARHPVLLPWIWRALTPDAVAAVFPQASGPVTRFHLPGASALNLLLEGALGGGGIASLRDDAQGKSYAQTLLGLSVQVPRALVPETREPDA
ncbi:MAG: acyclic terpene utilization AtuA family protein [Pseudomonadota bacterium]